MMKLYFYGLWQDTDRPTPALIAKVKAGNPTQLSDEIELVDMNYLLSKGSPDSLLIRVEGDSMCDEIQDGDWIVVAPTREPKNGDIVIASMRGEYTVKRFQHKQGLFLVPANANYKPREVFPADDFKIVGVVTSVIKRTV